MLKSRSEDEISLWSAATASTSSSFVDKRKYSTRVGMYFMNFLPSHFSCCNVRTSRTDVFASDGTNMNRRCAGVPSGQVIELKLKEIRKRSKTFDCSSTLSDMPWKSNDAIADERKVAIDFASDRPRIITDPNERSKVVIEEELRSKARLLRFSPYNENASFDHYLALPYFHNYLTRDKATALLEEKLHKNGSFLVRHSDRISGCFVISLVFNDTVQHYPISTLRTKDGLSLLTLDGGRLKFPDLMQLINFYQFNTGSALPTLLQHGG